MADRPILNDTLWNRRLRALNDNLSMGVLSEAVINTICVDTDSYIERYIDIPTDRPVPILSFNPPMHTHPMTDIACNDDLRNLATAAIQAAPAFEQGAAKRSYDNLVSLWTSANSLKELHRFASLHQNWLGRRPLPDGSNLYDEYINRHTDPTRPIDLINEWTFYRYWIRILHFGGLLQYPPPDENTAGLDVGRMLSQLYRSGRFMLEIELTKIQPDFADNFIVPNGHRVSWVRQSRSIIKQVLEEVATIAYQQQTGLGARMGLSQTAGPQPQMTKDQIFEQNMHPDRANRVFELMLKKYEQLMASHPFERLAMDLLRLENKFELSLTAEHVEDKLINKQMIQFNELNLKKLEPYAPQDILDMYRTTTSSVYKGVGISHEAWAGAVVKDAALVNRQRHNFRLIRDWSGLRPWRKIFQLYDTSTPETNWLQTAIKEFDDNGLNEEFAEGILIPSDPINKAYNYFGFNPLDYSDPDVREKFQGCGICGKEYVGGNTHDSSIAVLHCTNRHHFHLGCIFKYWDQEGNYLRECPECGEAPALNHKNIGVRAHHDDPLFDSKDTSFVLNVFNYNPADTIWNTMKPNAQNSETLFQERKNFYNIPPRPVPGGPRPQIGDEERHLYWLRENMHTLCYDSAPLQWVGEPVAPFSFMERGGRNPTDFERGWNRTVSDLRERWVTRRNDTRPRGFVDWKTYLSPSRANPAAEAAFLRKHRRRRDRNKRERIRAAREGLAGLGQTFI